MSSQARKTPVSINTLNSIKNKGEKFACLTAYDALFAELISTSGIDVMLVGRFVRYGSTRP